MTIPGDLKLELVQILFRHGARTYEKVEMMPVLQYVDQSLQETYGYGQLTNIGKAQAHNLGRVLRERYHDFLGPLHRPHEVYAHSSNYDRTKASLQLVLAGLYPPALEQSWNKELQWQPIPAHYVPAEIDTLFKAFEMTKYLREIKVLYKSPEYQEILTNIMKLHEFFDDNIIDKLNKFGFHACMAIFNVLYIHKVSNGKLPDWYTDDLLNILKEHVIYFFDVMSSTTELSKWSIGPLIKRFLENMNINGEMTNPRKIYLYSGHELNIAAFTRAHKIDQFKYPDFSSAVILEKLRDSKNQLYVRLLAWTGTDYITLKLGKFEEYCPIDEYLKIVENVTPTDDEIDSMLNDVTAELKNIHTTDFVFKSKSG